jgi:eukaryotic-like serine/threonine-protein kinase
VPNKPADDDLVMSLVERAMARPIEEREAYLDSACSGNAELFGQVRSYVESEERMHGFLLEPLLSAAEPEHPFEPGELLDGRFRIVREVAQGGMGVVYEAVDGKLERRIAVKCAKAGFGKRLPPEVRHASEISHPNVCKIFEIHSVATARGEIDFITMEFLEGETLAERLGRGPIPQKEARMVARQLAAGLAEAHRNRVIHGDLKSNNIILTTTPDGAMRAVITDFGLARGPKAVLATGPSGTRGGTPDYMAPELWKGEPASTASDVYALGVILYELASGHKPFGRAASDEERAARKPPPVNSQWDRVLARCLEPNPARRFGAADEVAQALAPSNSRLWFLAAAAAAVLAVATGLVTYQRAAGPKEQWRLAMLPVDSGVEVKSVAERLTRDAAGQLAHLKGGNVARLSVIPLGQIQRGGARGATHVLHATLTRRDDGELVLHAVLTDSRRQVSKEWTAEYAPGEMRYAPVALAGMVTSQLGLPPLVAAASVNSAAARDYWKGLWYLRRYSTIDAALPLLERAVAEDQESPLPYAALAEARQWKWYLTKDGAWLERADESERQAQRRNPDLVQVHRAAGLLSHREGRDEQAMSECLRAIALDPHDGEAHRVLGQAYEALNRLDEALSEYRRAVEVDPGDYRNHQQLGTFYYNRTNYAEALTHFLKMGELAPGEAASHSTLGAGYFALGRLPEAERELRLAIGLGETAKDLHNLGLVLMEEIRYPEAAVCILRALRLAPEQLIWLMNLGTAYRLMNNWGESEKAYRRALDLGDKEIARDPRNGITRSYLAFVCARLDDRKRAESEIAQALQMSPNDGKVRFMAAATLEAIGHREDTLKLLSTFSDTELADVNRWPDMADLSRDPRFLQLLASRQIK